MNSDLKITTEQHQAGVAVTAFRIRGWLDAQSEGQLLQEAQSAYDGGARIDQGALDRSVVDGVLTASTDQDWRVMTASGGGDWCFLCITWGSGRSFSRPPLSAFTLCSNILPWCAAAAQKN
jgi:hypothetical protein